MKQYGIFSPTMGDRQDVPSMLLADAFTADSSNVQIRHGEIHRCAMRRAALAAIPDGAAIRRYHTLEKADGTNYLFAFTDAGIFKWDNPGGAWGAWLAEGLSLTEGDPAVWSAVTFGDYVIATNGADKIVYGNDSTKFASLGGASGVAIAGGVYMTAAKFLAVWENRLFAGGTVEDGASCNQRLRWASIGQYDQWDSDQIDYPDAGYNDVEGPDAITAAAVYRDFLIITKSQSYHRAWLTGGDLLFAFSCISRNLGCVSPDSLVTGKDGELYFLATDKTIRNVAGLEISRAKDKDLKSIPDKYLSLVRGYSVSEYGEIWWAVPRGPDATASNCCLVLQEGGKWTSRTTPVEAFGSYKRQNTLTFDTAPATMTYENMAGSFDAVDSIEAFPVDLCSDAAGNSYELHAANSDAGGDYDGQFVLATHLTKGIDASFKRLLSMTIYAHGEAAGSTMTVEAATDYRGEYRSLGSFSLAGAGDIEGQYFPCDLRGKHFLLRFTGDKPFRFIGVSFEFDREGVTI